jgi:hypothetical protein
MPDPAEYDDEKEWMEVCVPTFLSEGKDQDQAVAACMQMWRDKDKEPAAEHAVKAVGDWELEVCAVPFGADGDEQTFDANANYMLDAFASPVITYHHGILPGKTGAQQDPVIIGKTLSVEKRKDGIYLRVLLDKTVEFAKRVWEAAKKGLAVASSDSIAHLARLDIGGKLIPYDKSRPGRIAVWPLAGVSLWDKVAGNFLPASPRALALPAMKAIYEKARIDFPVIPSEQDDNATANIPAGGAQGAVNAPERTGSEAAVKANNLLQGDIDMDEKEVKTVVASAVADAMKAQGEANALAQKAETDRQAIIAAEVAKQVDAYKAEAAKGRRLPMGDGAPFVAQFGDTWKYDNLSPGELGLVIDVLNASGKGKPSAAAIKALAIKLVEDKRDFGQPELGPGYSLAAMKAAGIDPAAVKTEGDPLYTGGTTQGAYWLGTAYARELWGVLRAEANIVAKIPSVVIPDGFPAEAFPLEGTDPTWYGVSETSAGDSTLKVPAATVTSSQITTPAQRTLSVKKIGARVLYTGEMVEDALISFVPQLRSQIITSGKEQLEHLIIDGDTTTTALTNINDIGNSSVVTAGTLFLQLDGLRHCALTNNSRAGGALDEDDYLETMWLMDTAGLAGADMAKCAFVIDPNVYKKSLMMASVKTKDVWANATLEDGVLTRLWGYSIFPSWFMHFKSATRKSNSAGKVDQTTVANNAYGAIMAVRWDQWKFGYKRQMTIETTRIANADAWEIVALARLGLQSRSTSASSITYGLTV